MTGLDWIMLLCMGAAAGLGCAQIQIMLTWGEVHPLLWVVVLVGGAWCGVGIAYRFDKGATNAN